MFVLNVKTRASAENDCVGKDSHLASIHSVEEIDFLNRATTGTQGMWIGGQKKENSFQWLDGTKFDFTDWDGSQPNYFDGENCLVMTYIWETLKGKWHDVTCGHAFAYACKKPAIGNFCKNVWQLFLLWLTILLLPIQLV